jgi:hypothetical protein
VGADWKSAVYRKIEEEVKLDRGLTIERMTEMGRVSRSGFYRFDEARERPSDAGMNLRDAILSESIAANRSRRVMVTNQVTFREQPN